MTLTTAQAALGAAGIQTAGSLIGGMLSGSDSGNVGKKEYKDAAYGTIKGKVRAAQDMGLHPLFALGTSTPGPMQAIPGQSNWGSTAKEVGAIGAGALRDLVPQRTKAETDLLAAQTENWNLRNAALRKANADPAPHGAPTVSSGSTTVIPDEVVSSHPTEKHRTAGTHPAMTKHRMGTTPKGRGVYLETPGKMEDLELTRTLVEGMKVLGIYDAGLSVKENIVDFQNMMKSRAASRRGSTRKQRRQYRDWRK